MFSPTWNADDREVSSAPPPVAWPCETLLMYRVPETDEMGNLIEKKL
jgi:hypothetical protein